MLLGKRPRPRPQVAMRRTTSMMEFAPNAIIEDDESMQLPTAENKANEFLRHQWSPPMEPQRTVGMAAQGRAGSGPADWLDARHHGNLVITPSSLGGRHRRNSADFALVETAPFLRACDLCKRRLGPGRDTFMYRGDIAFCSLECRQQHINQDERKENCSLTSIKDISTATSGSEQSGDGEMVAAA